MRLLRNPRRFCSINLFSFVISVVHGKLADLRYSPLTLLTVGTPSPHFCEQSKFYEISLSIDVVHAVFFYVGAVDEKYVKYELCVHLTFTPQASSSFLKAIPQPYEAQREIGFNFQKLWFFTMLYCKFEYPHFLYLKHWFFLYLPYLCCTFFLFYFYFLSFRRNVCAWNRMVVHKQDSLSLFQRSKKLNET